MIFNSKANGPNEIFTMNNKELENPTNYTHLGIIRKVGLRANNPLLIDDRIQSAREAVYALMGACLHGHNGINPEVSLSLWSVYVRSRLL